MTENLESVPQANQLLYTMKLTTGEELMVTLVDEREHGIIVESPVLVRTIPIMDENGMRNEINSQSWMPFSKTRLFFIPTTSIMVLSPMHPDAHRMYVKLVNKLEIPSAMNQTLEEPSTDVFTFETHQTLQ
jgi:hypothetical protein